MTAHAARLPAFSLIVITHLAAAPLFEQTDVFTAGAEGYHTFRIPTIATAADGTLLAFVEGRKENRHDPGGGDIDLVYKRSTDRAAPGRRQSFSTTPAQAGGHRTRPLSPIETAARPGSFTTVGSPHEALVIPFPARITIKPGRGTAPTTAKPGRMPSTSREPHGTTKTGAPTSSAPEEPSRPRTAAWSYRRRGGPTTTTSRSPSGASRAKPA